MISDAEILKTLKEWAEAKREMRQTRLMEYAEYRALEDKVVGLEEWLLFAIEKEERP